MSHAFPVPENYECIGLTKRELFSAMVLQALLGDKENVQNEKITDIAVTFAISLIDSLEDFQDEEPE